MVIKHARSNAELVSHLRQLVEALDRRVPHVERDGEFQIACDAHALKELALRRLEQLEDEGPAAAKD
jgi:uncharacterized protein (DUF849 family)